MNDKAAPLGWMGDWIAAKAPRSSVDMVWVTIMGETESFSVFKFYSRFGS